jgi:hypothetical protein
MRFAVAGGVCLLVLLSGQGAWAEAPLLLSGPATNVSFPFIRNDAGGYRWDVQHSGYIGSGNDNAYGNGAYCYINGSTYSSWRQMRIKDSREVQLGPSEALGLRYYRRIRVYEKFALCRWIEVLENPTDQDISVEVRVYSYMTYGIGQTRTSDGDAAFGQKDTGFFTVPAHNVGRTPGVAQIVCGPKAPVRPKVEINGNQINVRYRITVPAGQTVGICYFHSQNRNADRLGKLLQDGLAYHKLMRDLPAKACKKILNFVPPNPLAHLELDRDPWNDVVLLEGRDRLVGDVTNEQFELETSIGRLKLPAGRVVGMRHLEGGHRDSVRVLTGDGQILVGKLRTSLKVHIPAAGDFTVDPSRISQWSYRLSSQRPEDSPFKGPYVVLKEGSRLAYDPEGLAFGFRTRLGLVELDSRSLAMLLLSGEDHLVHRAVFPDGSTLGGVLEGPALAMDLREAPEPITLPIHAIHQFEMRPESAPEMPRAAEMESIHGDLLRGDLENQEFQLQNSFGRIPIPGASIYAISGQARPALATVRTWDGSTHQGKLTPGKVAFRLGSGQLLHVPLGEIRTCKRNSHAMPKDVEKTVAKLIARLAAESQVDRETARDELAKMGRAIVPTLRVHLKKATDSMIHQGIEEILEKIEGAQN